jgi:hypothetical protein
VDYAASGIVIVVCAVLFQPTAWVAFTSFGACVGSFGAWAIADRELREPPESRSGRLAWRLLRGAASVFGTAGAVMLLFLLLAVGLGTWKS